MLSAGGISVFRSVNAYKLVQASLQPGQYCGDSEGTVRRLAICSEYRLPATTTSIAFSPRQDANAAARGFLKALSSRVHKGEGMKAEIIARYAEVIARSENEKVGIWFPLFTRMVDSEDRETIDLIRFLFAVKRSKCPATVVCEIERTLIPLIILNIRQSLEWEGRLASFLEGFVCSDSAKFKAEMVTKFVGRIRIGETPVTLREAMDALRVGIDIVPQISRLSLDVLRSCLVRGLIREEGRGLSNSDLSILIRMASIENPRWKPIVDFAIERVDLKQLSVKEFFQVGGAFPSISSEEHTTARAQWRARAFHLLLPNDKSRLEFDAAWEELLECVKRKSELIEFHREFPDGLPCSSNAKASFCGFFLSATLAGAYYRRYLEP